jgi:multidrug efflux pump subunit AcrA (membrane-fusion protein)
MVFAVTLAGCGSISPAPGDSPDPGQVETVAVQRADLDSVYVASGQVVAAAVVVVRAPEAGRVAVSAGVKAGARVAQGDQLLSVAGKPVVARVGGVVESVLVGDGDQVAVGLPVVALRLQRFAILATVPAADAYRVYTLPSEGTAEVTGGPGGLQCPVFAPHSPEQGEPGQLAVLCVLDAEAAVVEGLPARVGIKTGSADGVLALPVSAVQGDVQRGVVTKVENGVLSRIEVGLGITDGIRVEITSGLAEGDQVVAFAPGLG